MAEQPTAPDSLDWCQGPVKHSVMIAGHATSVTLEPLFWQALQRAAQARVLPLSALIAQIDALRLEHPDPPNLASTIRLWLAHHHYVERALPDG